MVSVHKSNVKYVFPFRRVELCKKIVLEDYIKEVECLSSLGSRRTIWLVLKKMLQKRTFPAMLSSKSPDHHVRSGVSGPPAVAVHGVAPAAGLRYFPYGQNMQSI